MARRVKDRAERSKARYDDVYNRTPHKYKQCDFCGRNIVINNYPDGKSRTPKWMGYVICPWCTPANYKGTVVKPIQYKTIMSRVLVEKLAALNICLKDTPDDDTCKCLGHAARKLTAIKEKKVEV